MSDTPVTTLSAATFLASNETRRGAIPTPSGALPLPRRRRRGMVNLKAWDDQVAAQNAANGTASISQKAPVFQMLDPDRIAQAEGAITAAATRPPEGIDIATPPGPLTTPPAPVEAPKPQVPKPQVPKPHDPDAADEVVAMQGGQTMTPARVSSGAILEDFQVRPAGPAIHLPTPNPEALAAAKAALAAELEAANSQRKVPPPPGPKPATKTAKKTATKTEP